MCLSKAKYFLDILTTVNKRYRRQWLVFYSKKEETIMREELRKGIVDYFCKMAEVQMAGISCWAGHKLCLK